MARRSGEIVMSSAGVDYDRTLIKIIWTQNWFDMATRTSNITVSLQSNYTWGIYGGWGHFSGTFKVNGNEVYNGSNLWSVFNQSYHYLEIFPYGEDRVWTYTFNVQHDASGNVNIPFYFDCWAYHQNSQGVPAQKVEKSASLYLHEEVYTKCSAPTSVSAAAYAAPGGNLAVSWSGAQGGTANAITGYDIYWKISADGAAPTTASYDGKVSVGAVESATCTIAAGATRGHQIKVGVVAKGGAGASYYSPMSTVFGTSSVNRLPNAPTISCTTVVPSTGGDVVFTAQAGADPDTGQTLTLYYEKGDGTKTLFTSPLTQNITTQTIFNFYTFDGLEYSPATSETIYLNTKPVITALTANTVGTYSALNSNGASGDRLSWADTIQPVVTASKTGTVKVSVEMAQSNSTTRATTNKTYSYSAEQFGSSPKTLSNYDIGVAAMTYYALDTVNVQWRLKVVVNDGIEDSDPFYLPNNTSKFYAIAHAPTISAKYNQFANSNISGTNSGEMWKQVRLRFYKDESSPEVSAVAKIGSTNVSVTNINTFIDNNYRVVDITIADDVAGGEQIDFEVTLSHATRAVQKVVRTSMKETLTPSLSTFSFGSPLIKPFTDTGSFAVSFGYPFGTHETLAAGLAAYNCGSTAIKLRLSTPSAALEKTPTWTKNADTLTASLNKATFYPFGNALGISYYAGIVNYNTTIIIQNLFGKVYTSQLINCQFDFKEKAQNVQITEVQWATAENPDVWTAFGTNDKLQQNLRFRVKTTFGLLTEDQVRIALQLSYDGAKYTEVTAQTFTAAELNRATGRTPASNTQFVLYGVIPEIINASDWYWRIEITTSGGTQNSTAKSMGVLRHTAPPLTLNTCMVDEEYRLMYSYSYTEEDTGGGVLKNYLYSGESNISNELVSPSDTVPAQVVGWSVKTIQVHMVSTVTGLITNTFHYYSNGIVVHSARATIAYRKNHMGINITTPANDSLVHIGSATGRDKVITTGFNTDGDKIDVKLNVNTAQIGYYKDDILKNTLDLTQPVRDDYVSYAEAQPLTSAQKAQARSNIDAANSGHTHTPASIGAAAASHNHQYNDLTGVAATNHNHTLDNLNGTLSTSKGGTGQTSFAALMVEIYKEIYQVGGTPFLTLDSRNPSEILGFGTWQKLEGRMIMGASAEYPVGSTGGEAEHTLTIAEMPTHKHGQMIYEGGSIHSSGYDYTITDNCRVYDGGDLARSTGGGQPHNNMPPYKAYNIWERIA